MMARKWCDNLVVFVLFAFLVLILFLTFYCNPAFGAHTKKYKAIPRLGTATPTWDVYDESGKIKARIRKRPYGKLYTHDVLLYEAEGHSASHSEDVSTPPERYDEEL
jgi:hypothetical protein